MTEEIVHITRDDTNGDFQIHNLIRNEGIWLQVENFDLRIKRTDEGIVVDIYDTDCDSKLEPLASTYAFDNDTASFREDD